tara:strand:- start:10 stop:396 length:387 start_codon:yes stop_codon:yes gene_type:complete
MNKLFAYIKISLAILTGFCLGSMYYYDSNGQVVEDFIHLGAAYSSGFLFVLMCFYASKYKIKKILSYSIDYFLYTVVGAAMVLFFLNDENTYAVILAAISGLFTYTTLTKYYEFQRRYDTIKSAKTKE